MIDWIEVLEILAVALAAISVAYAFAVLVAFVRWFVYGLIGPKANVVQEKQKEQEKPTMSKDTTSEGITFNDIFMFMIAVPLVLLWVGFAGFVIHTGLNNSQVLENIEAYTTLIAILGGPAILIIKDALDVWKQE